MTLLKAATLSLALLSGGPLLAQSDTQLTTDQVRALSLQLLENQQPQEAGQLSLALLERNPDDLIALIVASRAALDLGDAPASLRFARRAFWASELPGDSFVAARLAANALAADGKDTRSQVWLRRARQYAPDEETSQAVARDYQALRQRNPWSTSLSFAITPSSNVNNGTLNETAKVLGLPITFDLSRDAQPLSGLQISGGFNARYRIYGSPTSALFFDIDSFGRTYALSNESKEEAPGIKGSDFSDVSAGIGLTYRTLLAEGWQPTQAGLRFGRTWYAGDPFTRTISLSFSQPFVLNERNRLTLSASSQVRENEDGDPWVRTRRGSVSWDHSLANGDTFGVSLSGTDAVSQDIQNDYTGFGIGLSYAFAKPFQSIAFSGAINFDQNDYVDNIHEPGPRTDETLRLRLNARLTNVEFYGFQPVVTLDSKRSSSNVEFYDDRNSFNLGFDLRSSF